MCSASSESSPPDLPSFKVLIAPSISSIMISVSKMSSQLKKDVNSRSGRFALALERGEDGKDLLRFSK